MLKSLKKIKVRGGIARNEEGASLAEYALLIALVLIGAGVALTTLTGAVSNAIDDGTDCLEGTHANCMP